MEGNYLGSLKILCNVYKSISLLKPFQYLMWVYTIISIFHQRFLIKYEYIILIKLIDKCSLEDMLNFVVSWKFI